MKGSPRLVGVDVGASKVAAHEVLEDATGAFDVGPCGATVEFESVPEFRPLAVEEQVRQLDLGELLPAPGEREQARLWVEGITRCIAAVTTALGRPLVLLGVAAPGLKSPDGAGLVVVRNGPRVPELCDLLERHLRRAGIELAAPIEPLRSDGIAGCLGEHRSGAGALHDVDLGYYLAGGTGLAEAVLAGGEVHGMDADWIGVPPAWKLRSARHGESFEDSISMRAIATGKLGPAEIAYELAELLRRRLEAFSGACSKPFRPERIVLAQALGLWLTEDAAGREVHARLLDEHFLNKIGEREAPEVVVSTLRPAPAIGAAVLAREAYPAF